MKIDVFNHYFPPEFFEFLSKKLPPGPVNRWKLYKPLYDLDARLRQVDEFDDYCQILSLSQPPINELGTPEETPALARMANDGLSEVCKDHPDHFPGFLAGLPMNNIDAAVKEIERCLGLPGFVGVQLHTNVSGRALDEPEFFPVFETHGADRQAGLAASLARRQLPRLPGRRRNRNTRSGGCSAGTTRSPRRWRGSCSGSCSTSCRTSR